MKQTQLIHETDWNVLIILDACRYDSFKDLYKNHLKGTLKKAMSPGSNTPEWLAHTWTDKYDLTYVSGNPYVNTQGVPIGRFVARNHFTEIIDVWNLGWNEELGTVHPEQMNEATLSTNLKPKSIIHYVQPHRPYIGRKGRFSRPGSHFRQDILGLPMPPQKPTQKAPHFHQTKKAYADTLDLVLIYVAELMPQLEGKVVVSADHGELLGERIDGIGPRNIGENTHLK